MSESIEYTRRRFLAIMKRCAPAVLRTYNYKKGIWSTGVPNHIKKLLRDKSTSPLCSQDESSLMSFFMARRNVPLKSIGTSVTKKTETSIASNSATKSFERQYLINYLYRHQAYGNVIKIAQNFLYTLSLIHIYVYKRQVLLWVHTYICLSVYMFINVYI